MSNVNYLVSGQFDVIYNGAIINVVVLPLDGTINDTLPPRYCGPVLIDISPAGIGGSWKNSGCLRILFEVPWAQSDSGGEPCAGGDGTGPCGDGYLTTLTFRGVSAGTCDIAFGAGPGGKKQVNQIVDWVVYQDYSYPCNPNPAVSTPTPCVPDSVLTWGAKVSVTVQ